MKNEIKKGTKISTPSGVYVIKNVRTEESGVAGTGFRFYGSNVIVSWDTLDSAINKGLWQIIN
jgi:hypothetical protein